MNVSLHDMGSSKPDNTLLMGITRLSLSKEVRRNLFAIWDDLYGIILNIDGPFVVSSDGPNQVPYTYLLIKEPA